jgi:hypothetical protein
MAEFTPPTEQIVAGHFIVSDDVERSRRFYTEVLGGTMLFPAEPAVVRIANTWIVINTGGGPTDDKPAVTLETPRDRDRASSFLNFRVKDIAAVYAEWSARGGRIPDAAQAARLRDPLLHPRSRRLPDRGGTDHQPPGRLVAVAADCIGVKTGLINASSLLCALVKRRGRSTFR